jgi:hypothetical protein
MTPYANQSSFSDEAFPNVPCLTLLSEQEKGKKKETKSFTPLVHDRRAKFVVLLL